MRDLADHADEAAAFPSPSDTLIVPLLVIEGATICRIPPEPAPPLGPFTVFCVWQPDV